jgi:hypothetical protein
VIDLLRNPSFFLSSFLPHKEREVRDREKEETHLLTTIEIFHTAWQEMDSCMKSSEIWNSPFQRSSRRWIPRVRTSLDWLWYVASNYWQGLSMPFANPSLAGRNFRHC